MYILFWCLNYFLLLFRWPSGGMPCFLRGSACWPCLLCLFRLRPGVFRRPCSSRSILPRPFHGSGRNGSWYRWPAGGRLFWQRRRRRLLCVSRGPGSGRRRRPLFRGMPACWRIHWRNRTGSPEACRLLLSFFRRLRGSSRSYGRSFLFLRMPSTLCTAL